MPHASSCSSLCSSTTSADAGVFANSDGGPDANGALIYRLRNIGTDLLPPPTFENTLGINEVWRSSSASVIPSGKASLLPCVPSDDLTP